jgi:hypothetical protein
LCTAAFFRIKEAAHVYLYRVKRKPHFSNAAFYRELQSSLATSTGAQRRAWALTIAKQNVDLKELSALLKEEDKAAKRFLWLLSDVGLASPEALSAALPFLLKVCGQFRPAYTISFASLWHIVGVPPADEAQAIDLLFRWVQSAHSNATMKTRSFWVLMQLTKKYPELKNELKLCLEDQMDNYSQDFRKRAVKLLHELKE